MDPKEMIKIRDSLIKRFDHARKQRIREEDFKNKEYLPITSAIDKLDNTFSEKISEVDKSIKNVLEENKTLIRDLVPFTKSIAEMEIPSSGETSFEKELFGKDTPIAKSTPFTKEQKKVTFVPMGKITENESDNELSDDSLNESKSSVTSDSLNDSSSSFSHILSPTASKNLAKNTDKHYGIYYDDESSPKIGKNYVKIDGSDLIINGKKYIGTKGLWILLTQKYEKLFDKNNKELYTQEDFNTYKEILIDSEALYVNNTSSSNRPKVPNSPKYKYLLKPIYEELKTKQVTGEGIINYNQHSVSYIYINNLNELISRLNLIYASEQAGDNNFHNEKVGIIRFLTNLLEKHIDDKKGTEYLIRLVNALPHKIIKDETFGSGLFNKILHNLPCELHYPGYNYLGPGTKLDERLERGDKPINKLDEAAKEHDIHYRDHKEVSERHIADKILENKAWERVISKDADLGERTAAYLTTNAMKIKRHLGMGLIHSEIDIFQ